MNRKLIDGDHSFTGEIENATATYIKIDNLLQTIKKNTWIYTLSIMIGVFFTIFMLKHLDKKPLTSSTDRATIVNQTLSEGGYINFWIFGSSVFFYSGVHVIGTFLLSYILQDYIASAEDLAAQITSVGSLDELNFINEQLLGVPHLDRNSVTIIQRAIHERAMILNSNREM